LTRSCSPPRPATRRITATRHAPFTTQATGQKLNSDVRPRVGLPDLRHSFVALALASGLTLPEASALARHADPRITAMAHAGLTDDARAGLGSKLWRHLTWLLCQHLADRGVRFLATKPKPATSPY
jgi:integrase